MYFSVAPDFFGSDFLCYPDKWLFVTINGSPDAIFSDNVGADSN